MVSLIVQSKRCLYSIKEGETVMKIVIALDFSEVTKSVISEGITMAKALSAEVVLLSVIQSVPDSILYDNTIPVVPLDDSIKEVIERRKKQLEESLSIFKEQNIPCITEAIEGDVASTILSYEEEHNVDYIIIGSHGHGALYHLVLGSVSEKVVDKARCPVLVVKK